MIREPNDPAFPPDAESRRQIENQVLLGLLLEERPDEGEGVIPGRAPTILQRLRLPLECLGGIVLGINIAVITIVFNFILFNFLLHMEF
ncbi:MAG TPA: hypothetical protein VN203_15915 [Candidatus Acidoferrum sp.]|nr:hypothetical protein [Candidatus Acidoferrum sp.]